MHEFEHTWLNMLEKHSMSLSDLARTVGYNPIFFRSVVSGKNRKVPVDFFIRIAEALILSNQEKDELVRSWALASSAGTNPSCSRAADVPCNGQEELWAISLPAG